MIKTVKIVDLKLTEARDQLRGEINLLQEQLEAVEKALSLGDRNGASVSKAGKPSRVNPAPRAVETSDKRTGRDYGAVGRAVEAALNLCPPEFQFSDIRNALEKDSNNHLKQEQISLALNRLIKKGTLKVVKERYGRIPAIYGKQM